MATNEVKKKYGITATELSKLVEDRQEGSLNVLERVYEGVSGLAKLLDSDVVNGLQGSEADYLIRREEFGSNQLELDKPASFFELCLEAIQDPTLIVLLVAATVSLGTGIYQSVIHHDNEYIEGLSIILTVIVVVLVAAGTDYMKDKQFRQLSDVASDIKMEVQRDGKTKAISIRDLVVGDILWVKYGDLLPADGILIDGSQLMADEAALTGEPILIPKSVATAPFLLSGTKIMEGSGKALIVAVGKYSQAGVIKNLASGKDAIKSWKPLDGTAAMVTGSATGKFSPLQQNLTSVVKPGDQVKIGEAEYMISKDGPLAKHTFTLERPYGIHVFMYLF